MTCPFSRFTSLQTRQLGATQPSNQPTVSINQFFRRPQLRVLVLHAHRQATQLPDYSCRNTLRAERLRYLFDRIVGLSQFDMRSRKVEPSNGLSGWRALS